MARQDLGPLSADIPDEWIPSKTMTASVRSWVRFIDGRRLNEVGMEIHDPVRFPPGSYMWISLADEGRVRPGRWMTKVRTFKKKLDTGYGNKILNESEKIIVGIQWHAYWVSIPPGEYGNCSMIHFKAYASARFNGEDHLMRLSTFGPATEERALKDTFEYILSSARIKAG